MNAERRADLPPVQPQFVRVVPSPEIAPPQVAKTPLMLSVEQRFAAPGESIGQLLARLYREKKTLTAVARHLCIDDFKVSRETVGIWMKALNPQIRIKSLQEWQQDPQFTKALRRKALENRRAALGKSPRKALRNMVEDQGLPQTKIAVKIGRGRSTVHRWLQEYGIKAKYRKRQRLSDEEIKQRRKQIKRAQAAGLFKYLPPRQQEVLLALYPPAGVAPTQQIVANALHVIRATIQQSDERGRAGLEKLLAGGPEALKKPRKEKAQKPKSIPEPLPPYTVDLTGKPSWFQEIAVLGLSNRTYNALCRAGISTIREAYETPDEDLLKIRAFGETCLADLREKLEKFRQELLEKPRQ